MPIQPIQWIPPFNPILPFHAQQATRHDLPAKNWRNYLFITGQGVSSDSSRHNRSSWICQVEAIPVIESYMYFQAHHYLSMRLYVFSIDKTIQS